MKFKLPGIRTQKETNRWADQDTTGVPLFHYWLRALAGCMLAVLIGAGGVLLTDWQQLRGIERQRLQTASASLAAQLSATLSGYYKLLQGLASDPRLAELSAAGDMDLVAAEERRLLGLIPGSLELRLLPPGYDGADSGPEDSVGYASLDLLRIAEKSEQPPPLEMHLLDGSRLHLAGAAAIRDAQKDPLGLLHLALDIQFIRHLLATSAQEIGRIELQQKVNGRYVSLIDNGGERIGGAADFTYLLRNSHLRLAQWSNFNPRLPANSRLMSVMFVLIGLVLATLMVFWQYYAMKTALEADKSMLVKFFAALQNGFKGKKPESETREFSDIVNALLQPENPPESEVVADTEASAEEDAAVGQTQTEADSAAQPQQDVSGQRAAGAAPVALPEEIFRPYDIRGLVGSELTEEVMLDLGRAIGSQVFDQGQQSVMVAWDARASSEPLARVLIEGICATGMDVVELGLVPVPVLYFSTHFLGSNAGVMVTASHSGQDYNGLKIVMGGENVAGAQLQALRERVSNGDLLDGVGASEPQDLLPDYLLRINEDVSIARPMKLVLDCGNGSASLVAPNLFRSLGCEVVAKNCEVGGSGSRRGFDPIQPTNLRKLCEAVKREGAELGFAFDSDADRLGVVDSAGNIIWTDRLLMLLSADVLARHPGGDIVFDVNCSRALASQILQNGGRPVMWKSGHSLLKAKLRETGALLAGEWSGHVMFAERWYGFDDAMYTGARLLEILSVDPRSPAEVFAELPSFVGTPEMQVPMKEGEQYELMDRAQSRSDLLQGAKLITIDGIRAELEDAWGLMRAANTAPALSFRFEADNEEALSRVQDMYREFLQAIAPDLEVPF